MRFCFALLTVFTSAQVFGARLNSRLECKSASASISVLEEFMSTGNGYKVIIGRVSVNGETRSGRDTVVCNTQAIPATVFTAALPGITLALTVPQRTSLEFETNPVAAFVVINGGEPELASCTTSN